MWEWECVLSERVVGGGVEEMRSGMRGRGNVCLSERVMGGGVGA